MKKGMYAVLALCTIFTLVLGVTSCGGSTSAKDITVKFDLKGGTYTGDDATAAGGIPDVKIKENSSLGAKYPDATKLKGPTGTPEFKEWVSGDKVYEPTTKISKSITLEAKWQAAGAGNVTISFDTNAPADYTGVPLDAVTNVTIASGTAIGTRLPAKPKAGGNDVTEMAFLGWFKAATGGDQVTGTTTFSADTTVFAHWQVLASDEYIVTFDLNWDGAVPRTFERVAKTGVGIADWPADPARTGYTFRGWFEFPQSGEGSGDQFTDASTSFPDGSKTGSTANTVFAGWRAEGTGQEEEDIPPAGTDLVGAERARMTSWHAIYRFEMGDTKWSDIKSLEVEYMVGPANFEKTGAPRTMRIMGTYKDSDFSFNTILDSQEDDPTPKTLAVAAGDSKNAAYIMGAITTINQDSSSTIKSYLESQAITAEPWKWFKMTYPTDKTNKNANYSDDNYPTESQTPLYFGIGLTAMGNGGLTHYIRNVKLVSNDGTKDVKGVPLVYKVRNEFYPAFWGYGTTNGNDGGREALRRWADGRSWADVAVDLDVAVTFDLNYTGKPANTVVNILKGETVPADEWPANPTRADGQAFVAWNTRADGSGDTVISTQAFTASTTLYAIWADAITITLNPNGGNWAGSSANKTITIGTGGSLSTAQLEAPTRVNYRFDGWTTAAGAVVVAEVTTFSANATITAKWVETVAVTFDLNYKGSTPIVVHPDKGTAIADFPVAEWNKYYEFLDWNYRADGKGIAVDPADKFSVATTVYAIWSNKSLAPADLVYISTDPDLASEAKYTSAKINTVAMDGNYQIKDEFKWTVADMDIPAGFDLTSYESYTIKVRYLKEDGTTEVDPLTVGNGVNQNLGQFKFSKSATGTDDNTDVAMVLYNIGSLSDGTPQRTYGIKEAIPASVINGYPGTPILSMFMQGGGLAAANDVAFIEIYEFILHTALSGAVAVGNVDALDDPLFKAGAIYDQTWNVSKGPLEIKLLGYETYRWLVNGVVQKGVDSNTLTLAVKDYVDNINTNITVTVLALKDGITYSKTIVVTVKR